MSKMPAFVLPAGLEIDLTGDTLSLGYEGDIHLEQSLGRTLGEVYAGGDLVIQLDTITGSLRAGGKLVLDGGRIDADTLHGREVHLGKQDVKCRAISADERIVIGAAKLQVDVIIAPEIVLDPKTSGRVTIIESRNEPGPTKIKGGFSLKDYEESFGDPTAYLAERGLSALNGGPIAQKSAQEVEEDEEPVAVAVATPAPAPKAEPRPARASMTGESARSSMTSESARSSMTSESARSSTERPAGAITSPPPPREEDVSDPQSLSVEDLEPVAEPDADDELHPKLMDAVKRIASCYEGKETPPAVHQLRDLVEARDYDKLRENITEVWNGLLGFHQKKGIRPHHQVTHAFNVIHGLVQQG